MSSHLGKILVTGGAGYIGSIVSHKLKDIGYDVTVIDNLSTGHIENTKGLRLIQNDIGRYEILSSLLKSDSFNACFHFAASTSVPESILNPEKYFRNNAVNTLSLVDLCKSLNIKKFILSSTAAVYGESPVGRAVVETDPTKPVNPYGISKMHAEQIVQECFRGTNTKYIIFRYFNVAGASSDLSFGPRSTETSQLIRVAAQSILGLRQNLCIMGTDYPTNDGTAIRDFIHVEDLAELHTLGLRYLSEGGESEIINCGYSKGVSVGLVAEVAKQISGGNLNIVKSPRRQGDSCFSLANAAKAQRLLGWKPRLDDLEAILRSSLCWEKVLIGRSS